LAVQGKYLKISPIKLTESKEMRVQRLYPGSIVKSVTETLMIARPVSAAWEDQDYQESGAIGDTALLGWVSEALAVVTGGDKQKNISSEEVKK
jgi:transcription-repair coupling factor (superfamily II helicase)